MLRDLLAPIGFELLEAESGERALALCVERAPALMLLDLTMPEMDGYEVARQIRQKPGLEGLVIIASSANVTETVVRKSFGAGCNDFLPKACTRAPF